MRKILCLLALAAISSRAQNIDTSSPYVWEEAEVVDTLKAEELASKIRAERRLEAEKSNAKTQVKMTLLSGLKEKKQKKVQAPDDIALLKKIAEEYKDEIDGTISRRLNSERLSRWKTNVSSKENVEKELLTDLEKGKIHKDLFNSFDKIIAKQNESIKDVRQYDSLDFDALVSPLPKKTIKVKKDNPYYLDPDFHWLDRYETNKIKLKSTSFPVKEEYYAAEEYPQFKFYKDTYMSHRWLVYDLSGNLVAATMPTNADLSYHGVDWQMIDACSLYDFERNAYNINQESAAVRNYVAYTLKNGRSLRSQINSAELGQAMIDKMMAEYKRRRAAGRMTPEQYNKQYQEYQKTTAENQKQLAALRKQLPSKDIIERADNYVEQLKTDNEGRLSYNYEKSRIDGLNFVLVSESGLKLQQIGYYNSKENRVEWSYKVLEK